MSKIAGQYIIKINFESDKSDIDKIAKDRLKTFEKTAKKQNAMEVRGAKKQGEAVATERVKGEQKIAKKRGLGTVLGAGATLAGTSLLKFGTKGAGRFLGGLGGLIGGLGAGLTAVGLGGRFLGLGSQATSIVGDIRATGLTPARRRAIASSQTGIASKDIEALENVFSGAGLSPEQATQTLLTLTSRGQGIQDLPNILNQILKLKGNPQAQQLLAGALGLDPNIAFQLQETSRQRGKTFLQQFTEEQGRVTTTKQQSKARLGEQFLLDKETEFNIKKQQKVVSEVNKNFSQFINNVNKLDAQQFKNFSSSVDNLGTAVNSFIFTSDLVNKADDILKVFNGTIGKTITSVGNLNDELKKFLNTTDKNKKIPTLAPKGVVDRLPSSSSSNSSLFGSLLNKNNSNPS